jgi:phosphoribosylaminoimidazolecarboxamide formyltransferase/IMP cyclohydrolase
VAAVGSPAHYHKLVGELKRHHAVSAELRAKLAAESFGIVAAYYAEIAAYLNQITGTTFPNRLAVVLEKVDDLRYGENPHQRAAFYRETTHRSGTLADATQIRGDRPSFNNYLDLDTAYRIARDFTSPTVAIVKHTDPVGIASGDELVEAYRHALETDAVAAFGGIVGVNREMDGATAREIAANSYEAVVAPGYGQAALGILKAKAGLEILAVPPDPTEGMRDYGIATLDFKRVAGGVLVETLDAVGLDRGRLQVVTRRRPTLDELNDLLFAWRAVCHVRSNAIVLARNGATIGIGAAQASRQVSVEIALRRAGDRAKTAVMASDAYFPFPDGIQMAATAGVTAIIQPGGSIRDEMAIEVADRHHLAMVFTGTRHFRH